jgi:hypothetical protein
MVCLQMSHKLPHTLNHAPQVWVACATWPLDPLLCSPPLSDGTGCCSATLESGFQNSSGPSRGQRGLHPHVKTWANWTLKTWQDTEQASSSGTRGTGGCPHLAPPAPTPPTSLPAIPLTCGGPWGASNLVWAPLLLLKCGLLVPPGLLIPCYAAHP